MSIKSEADFKGLSRAGKVVSLTLHEIKNRIQPGMTTADLDRMAAEIFGRYGARSAPKLVYSFPGTILISVNDEIVHGIPGDYMIKPRDLVKIDVTAELDGYIADAAITVAIPPVSPLNQKLCNCVESAFHKAISIARVGRRIFEIGKIVETEVRRHGFTVLHELSGHGVGRAIHEEPVVPNYYDHRANKRLTEGLVITIEPIISAGTGRVVVDSDGWTIKTADGSI